MNKRPTIHTVAKAAGVGVGTVSRVLNNHAAVRDTTRQRVLSAIEELGYRPGNGAAPRPSNTKQVFLALPNYSEAQHQQMLSCTEQALAGSGLSLCALSLASGPAPEAFLNGGSLLQTGTGLFIAHGDLHDLWVQQPRDLPAVRIGGYSEAIDCAYIDDKHGGVLAGEYAATLPGQVVSLWPEATERTSAQRRIFEGLKAGLGQGGLQAEYTLTQQRSHPAQVAYVLEQLAARPQPTTLVTYSDQVAAEVLAQARKHGLNVGEQLRVIGYGDHDIAAPLGLTTVHVPAAKLSQAAVQLLQGHLRRNTSRSSKTASSKPKSGQNNPRSAPNSASKPERKCVALEPRLALRGTA